MRKKNVTRGIKCTVVTVVFANHETMQLEEKVMEIPGVYKTDAKLKEAIEATGIVSDTYRVSSFETLDVLKRQYAMTEDDFVRYATPLDGTVIQPITSTQM